MSRLGIVSCEPGKSAAAQRKNAALEMSPGMRASRPRQALASANANYTSLSGALALELYAKGSQSDFAVIAGAQRFFDAGLAIGEQAGEQQARLHLRAGYGHLVVDGF